MSATESTEKVTPGVVLDWTAVSMFVKVVSAEGHAENLGISVQPGGGKRKAWIAFALATDAKTVEAVFERHSHDIIGEFNTLNEAFAAAERYAEEWAARNGNVSELCPCGEIDAAPVA